MNPKKVLIYFMNDWRYKNRKCWFNHSKFQILKKAKHAQTTDFCGAKVYEENSTG